MKRILCVVVCAAALLSVTACRPSAKESPQAATHKAPAEQPKTAAGETHERLYRIFVKEKWGYINRAGKVVIQPRFANAKDFHEGLALVSPSGGDAYDRPSNEFIDTKGNVVIAHRHDVAYEGSFSNGLALISSLDGFGFMDRTGKTVLGPLCPPIRRGVPEEGSVNARDFSEGLAAAVLKNWAGIRKWGYIDTTGACVIKPRFAEAYGFSEGLARVVPSGFWRRPCFIDRTGRIVIKPKCDDAGAFHEGMCAIEVGGKYGYIDATGTIVIEPQFALAFDFSEGLAPVAMCEHDIPNSDEAWGFVDKTGRLVIPAQFRYVSGGFSEGLAAVGVGNKCGFIDKGGRFVIGLRPAFFYAFSGGMAEAGLWNGGFGYIDRSGKWVWKPTK